MYIYVISTEHRDKPVKIGKTSNPKERLQSLQTGNFETLHIKHLIKCKDSAHAIVMEGEIHRVLNRYRINGEWFSVEGLGRFRKICSKLPLILPKLSSAKMACWNASL